MFWIILLLAETEFLGVGAFLISSISFYFKHVTLCHSSCASYHPNGSASRNLPIQLVEMSGQQRQKLLWTQQSLL